MQWYVAKAVHLIYSNLKCAKYGDKLLQKVKKLMINDAKWRLRTDLGWYFLKKRLLAAKFGCKIKIPEPCIALIEWFMDAQTSLNAKLPRDLFL